MLKSGGRWQLATKEQKRGSRKEKWEGKQRKKGKETEGDEKDWKEDGRESVGKKEVMDFSSPFILCGPQTIR